MIYNGRTSGYDKYMAALALYECTSSYTQGFYPLPCTNQVVFNPGDLDVDTCERIIAHLGTKDVTLEALEMAMI